MKASELLLQSAAPFDRACLIVREMEVELCNIRNVAQAADELMATLGAEGEIDTLHPKTQRLLDALYAWRPLFAEVSNVKLRGAAILRRPSRTPGWAVVIARNDAFSY